MSTLSPGEMDLLTSTTDLFSIQALAKMPESDQICLANKYGESYRVLRSQYFDLLGLQKKLEQDLQKKQKQGSLNVQSDAATYRFDALGDPLNVYDEEVPPHVLDDRLTPALCEEVRNKERADDLTLEKLPPLGQLTHIRDAARKMFVDRPKVEARIEVLKREVRGESSADKEWRKGEEERMERVMKAREAALAEKKMYGEGENGAWWEND